MEFNIQIKNYIKNLALKKSEQEICGFIYLDKKTYKFDIYPCQNRSEDKKNNFTISPQDFLPNHVFSHFSELLFQVL